MERDQKKCVRPSCVQCVCVCVCMDYRMRVHIPVCDARAAQAIFRDMPLPIILAEQLCDPGVEDKITCPVCKEILHDAKCHGGCGYYLCDGCWTRCLHSGNDECPICRCKVDAESIKWNQGMEMFMASIQIRCGFAHKGCCWEGQLETYATHARDCPAKRLQEFQTERDEKNLLASQVDSLQAAVKDRDDEIEELKVKLGQSRSFVGNLSSMFDSAMGEIRSKQMKIAALEASVDDKEAQIRMGKKQLVARGKQIAAKDRALKEQLFTLRAKDDKVGELCDTLRQTLNKDRMRDELETRHAKLEGSKKRRLERNQSLPSS